MSRLDRALLSKYLLPQWPRAVLLGGLLLTWIGAQLANPQIARTFIDQAQAGVSFDRLIRIAVVFLVVAVVTQAAAVAESYVADDLGWRTTNALRADLTRHVLMLDGSFHSEHGAGELIERIDGDVGAIAGFFSRFVLQIVGNALFLVGVLLLLFREDWRIGLLLTAFALGALVYMTKGGGFVGVRARRARQSAAEFSGYVEERLGGLPDIKSSGADSYVMRRLHERLADRYQRTADAAMAISLFNSSIGLFFIVGTGASLVLSMVLHGSGAMTLGTVYLVFRYTTMLRLPLDRISRQMNSFQQATGGIVRVRDLLSTQSRVRDGAGVPLSRGAPSVELDEVSFAYGEEPVLHGVSFRLEPGEVLGMLGRTGSGKTTISRLLFRLHDPIAGVVRLGGTDVRDARLDELRDRIALVTQDVQLFQGTLRDNVTVFDETVPDGVLRDVFGELGLAEWLRALPGGLDTELGSHGRGLSAGEAQLVALARVFLKDPGLVVLDEASSRLDPATERLLEQAMTRLLDGRTGVVIAHRLATVQRADKILVLEDGRVAELGPREALAADRDSRFARLLRAGMEEVLT
ncbi:MAG TPA: ABC transporter ATP-binding protein [Actinomycetota bacterium]|jgi:ABC-type multidrug transport system fused ATPase/permease subunit|nr:ABC transporter ATP-binding protein [Actinomycetota bacterium]